MSAQESNTGRDYIVEYRAGQFQDGSLVLRFSGDPSEREIRDALVAHGLPRKALEQVRARPMSRGRRPTGTSLGQPDPARPRDHRFTRSETPQLSGTYDPRTGRETRVSSAAGTTGVAGAGSVTGGRSDGQGTEKKGGCLGRLIGLTVAYFVIMGFISTPAINLGQVSGDLVQPKDNPVTECLQQLDSRTYDQEEGLLGQLVSREVTNFPVTPANAAFLVSCVAGAVS